MNTPSLDTQQGLEAWARQTTAQDYVGIAGFCVLLYDILLTWNIEIQLVWPASWSLVKVLFLTNRYGTPLCYIWVVYMLSNRVTTPTDDAYCFEYVLITLLMTGFINDGVGGLLLTLRVYALYNRDKRVLALLSVLLLLQSAIPLGLALWASILAKDNGWLVFEPGLHSCIFLSRAPMIWLSFLFMAVFDFVVFFLIFRRTWQYMWKRNVSTPLLTVMVVDGTWYFVVMLLGEVFNLVAMAIFPNSQFYVGMNISWCINSTVMSRIYLNLRNTARPQNWTEGTTYDDAELDFARHAATFVPRGRFNNTWDTYETEDHEEYRMDEFGGRGGN